MAFQQQKKRTCNAVTASSVSFSQKKPRLEWQLWSKEISVWLDREEKRNPDSSGHPDINNAPTWEASPNITVPLMSHQKEWLYWALDQEASDIKGGILADDMGMGKTLQAISLVITSRDLPRGSSGASTSTSTAAIKTTLVVCPVAALMQWAEEIIKCTKRGTATVYVYHGTDRAERGVDFRKYDFVLTTFATLANDYRDHIMLMCNYCKGKFVSDRELQTHQRNKCGPLKARKEGLHQRRARSYAPDGMSLLHLVKWKRIILDEVLFIHTNLDSINNYVIHKIPPTN